MNRPIKAIRDVEVIYCGPAPKKETKASHLLSWLTSFFQKKVMNDYAEQRRALNFLEKKIVSWNRATRHDAVTTLNNINMCAYNSMRLSPEQRRELQERVEELKNIYVVHPGGINYADIVAERNYEISTLAHIKQLVGKAQDSQRRIALAARRELLNLEVTCEHNSASLNSYLVEELGKAQEAIKVLIESEERLAAKLKREADLLAHKERLTDGGQVDLLGALVASKQMLVATPFSRPLFDGYNAFDAVEELAKLEPSEDALFQIERHRKRIVGGGAGRELEKVVARMQEQIKTKVQGLKVELQKVEKHYNESAPYCVIYQQLAPLRRSFSIASTLKSLEQTIALIDHRITQLDFDKTLSMQGLATYAIDPFQAQQIMQADDADKLQERIEVLIAERDRLAVASGLHSDLLEEGRITLSQSAEKVISIIMQQELALHQMIGDLNMKQRIYRLVLDESEEAEKIIREMKESHPELVQKIENYYQEALGLNGYFLENISTKIEENAKQIAQLKKEASKITKRFVKKHTYKRMETLSFDLQEIARIAKRAVKGLGKEHPELAKRLKEVSLRDLSDATKLGAHTHEIYLQKASLELSLNNAQYLLNEVSQLRDCLQTVSEEEAHREKDEIDTSN